MLIFFFFNASSTTEIYTLSLHDALPISIVVETVEWLALRTWLVCFSTQGRLALKDQLVKPGYTIYVGGRSEEHTSELQSHSDLVCRLLLEKKKKKKHTQKQVQKTYRVQY